MCNVYIVKSEESVMLTDGDGVQSEPIYIKNKSSYTFQVRKWYMYLVYMLYKS